MFEGWVCSIDNKRMPMGSQRLRYSSTQALAWQAAGRGHRQDVLFPSTTPSLAKTGTQWPLLPLLWFAGIWAASKG